jgi:phage head maturation protease
LSLDAERKSLTEFKLNDKDEVEAIFSTFDVVDHDRDVITRQALAPYDGQTVMMVDSHNWGIGHWLGKGRISVGTKYARFVGSFLDTSAGRDAHVAIKEGQGVTEWSWSFQVGESHPEERDGRDVRVITKLAGRPFEVSPVLVGAGIGTGTVAIKAALKEALSETALFKYLVKEAVEELKAEEIVDSRLSDESAETEEKDAKPIPSPRTGESQQDFMSRCMGNDVMNEDFPEQEQRSAVCMRQWREERGEDEESGDQKSVQVPAHLTASLERFKRLQETYGSI